ncbi:MAG: hypothetical protein NZM40_01125 [Sphingomonadaceae bacterium]|uniref:hypothetical protein n=1 Tax=Thermaurantiacus sp. TaxID=2820283 RepID=UPI00298F3A91|nr:hypothetical protein [Thermaurantiacus sp.]MCS6986044.1 hypothetical protein [Sphingomonadaceae bacterium]MDW8414740.1 hypothetical protein [Thermaurantiacus sp.]
MAGLLLVACSEPPSGPPRFALSQCRVHDVIDGAAGRPLVGIEDLDRTPKGELVLSAYDRPAVEQALARGVPPPEGGLHRVELAALLAGTTRSEPLLPAGSVTGGLRPHGIAVRGSRLAVVNRRVDGQGRLDPVVMEVDLPATGPPAVRAIHKAGGFCALNDVAFDGDLVLATIDRASCDGPGLADLFPGAATGRLVELSREAIRTVAQGFRYANGVVVLPDGRVAVAETLGRRLRLSDGQVIELPGAPDNLSLAPDGRIVVAVQPSLLRFALWRRGWTQRAGSRVLAVDPVSGAIETLFDDPTGRTFAGATAALWTNEGLVAGSVLAGGLLVCRAPAR